MKSSYPQAVFFDFDGVLVESADIKTDAFVDMFSEYSQEVQRAVKEYHLRNMGISRYRKFEWIYENLLFKPLSKSESDKLGEQFSALVYEKILAAPLVDGSIQLLSYLKGYSLCFVASGTPQDELERIVNARDLRIFFNDVCGTPRTKTQIIQEMQIRYSLVASQCWFIGDAQTDYEAAMNTGLNFVARTTPAMESFWQLIPSVQCVRSMSELLTHLQA